MAKQIVKDVFGELLETGKSTARASKKAAADITKQAVKSIVGIKTEEIVKNMYEPTDDEMKDKVGKLKGDGLGKAKALENLDKQKSTKEYEEIQRQIRLEQKKKEENLRQYETGKAEFDDERVKDPETFFDKMKKKKEEMKNKLPWASKKGVGTGEISRGASG